MTRGTRDKGVDPARLRYPRWVAPPEDPRRVAAFFDLDKTVIAKASMVAFSRPLQRAGMLSRRLMLKAAWGQLVYQMWGASPEKLEKLRESVLALTKGWDQAEISEIVRDALGDVIEPIVYDEALDRIRSHQRWGHRVFIVSASPEEVVAPIAQLLGVDEAIAHARRARRARSLLGPHRALRVRRGEGGGDAGGGRPSTASTSSTRGPTPTPRPTSRCWRRWATRWR